MFKNQIVYTDVSIYANKKQRVLTEDEMILSHRKVKSFSVCEDNLRTSRYSHPHVLAEPLYDVGFPFWRFLACSLCHTQMVGEGGELYNAILDLQIYGVTMFDV